MFIVNLTKHDVAVRESPGADDYVEWALQIEAGDALRVVTKSQYAAMVRRIIGPGGQEEAQ